MRRVVQELICDKCGDTISRNTYELWGDMALPITIPYRLHRSDLCNKCFQVAWKALHSTEPVE